MNYKLFVCGSRGVTDKAFIYESMASFITELCLAAGESIVIIHGGARGVDSIAGNYARDFGYTEEVYLPNWDTHGRKAGFLRNATMAEACDACLAIHDGVSKGTLNSINHIKRMGKPLKVVIFGEGTLL